MDKLAFENMDLSEFISSITNSMSIEFNKAIIKRFISDIIDIYNDKYYWYGTYKNRMEEENSAIDYSFNFNRCDFKMNFIYIPKHIILEEFAFNYIQSLRKVVSK